MFNLFKSKKSQLNQDENSRQQLITEIQHTCEGFWSEENTKIISACPLPKVELFWSNRDKLKNVLSRGEIDFAKMTRLRMVFAREFFEKCNPEQSGCDVQLLQTLEHKDNLPGQSYGPGDFEDIGGRTIADYRPGSY